jgi:N-acyl-D-amino-acid deacylase
MDYPRWIPSVLEKRGVSPNVASFIGAATPRVYVIGLADRPPSPEELVKMQALVRQAMEEGVGDSIFAGLPARVLR